MLKWPERAREAIASLFAPLQDIDVFVEDDDDEIFYLTLLRRALPATFRLERVVSLGSRSRVIAAANRKTETSRRQVFLIDGDFEWVRGEPCPSGQGLLRLEAYSIENLLLHEDALAQLVTEELVVSESSSRKLLQLGHWLESVESHLIDLFITFATVNAVSPEIPTVSTSLESLITHYPASRSTRLDPDKVRVLKESIKAASLAYCSEVEFNLKIAEIRARVERLPHPIRIVSGKDFLLPLADFHLRSIGRIRVQRKSLRLRLARLLPDEGLKELSALVGNILAAG